MLCAPSLRPPRYNSTPPPREQTVSFSWFSLRKASLSPPEQSKAGRRAFSSFKPEWRRRARRLSRRTSSFSHANSVAQARSGLHGEATLGGSPMSPSLLRSLGARENALVSFPPPNETTTPFFYLVLSTTTPACRRIFATAAFFFATAAFFFLDRGAEQRQQQQQRAPWPQPASRAQIYMCA